MAAGLFDPAKGTRNFSEVSWYLEAPAPWGTLTPAWGVCPCSGDGTWTARSARRTPPCPGPARYSGARTGPGPPAHETAARVALFGTGRNPVPDAGAAGRPRGVINGRSAR